MRQFFAMAIVFFAIKYLEERKYYKFLLFVLVASYFHIAALTAVGYIALEKLKWGDLKIKEKNLINIMYIVSPLAIFYIVNSTRNRVDPYFERSSSVENYLSYFLKIALFIGFIVFLIRNNKKNKNDVDNPLNNNNKMHLIYYFIGMILNGFGYIWPQFERIGYFYYIFAPNYVGIVAKDKENGRLFRLLLLFIIFRAFYYNCLYDSMGQMPFLFKWE